MCLLKRHNDKRTEDVMTKETGAIMCFLKRHNDKRTESRMTKETRDAMAKDRRVREYRTRTLNFPYITAAKTPLRTPKNDLFERLCN